MSEKTMNRSNAAAIFKPPAPPPDCATIRRLHSLHPGERFRYLTDVSGSTPGPACKALMERIRFVAHTLEAAGLIHLTEERHPIKSPKIGTKVEAIEYFATGKARCSFCLTYVIDPCQSSPQADHCLNNRRAA